MAARARWVDEGDTQVTVLENLAYQDLRIVTLNLYVLLIHCQGQSTGWFSVMF
jgi:hypothetical protein